MKSGFFEMRKHQGVVLDRPPEEVPPEFWTYVQNMQFDDGSSERVGGYAPYADAGLIGPPLFALNVRLEAVNYWLYAGADFVAVTDGLLHWDLTPGGFVGAVEPGTWSGCVLNGVPCLNNPRNPPMYWDFNTAGTMLTLPGWPVGALTRCLRAFKYHLFALGIEDGGNLQEQTLWWSAAAEPGAVPSEWVPTPANDAGDMTLGDEPGFLVDAQALRDTLVVYKTVGVYVLTYVAGQYIYTQRKLFSTIGSIGLNCVAEYMGEHWVITADDVIRHDGQAYRSALQDLIRDVLLSSIDPANIRRCCLAVHHGDDQVWVCVPTTGNEYLDRAYLLHSRTGFIGERDLPLLSFVARGLIDVGVPVTQEWDDDDQAWDMDPSFWDEQAFSPTEDSLLMCQPAGPDALPHLHLVDVEDTADGEPIFSLVERTGLPMIDLVTRGYLTRVFPRIDGQAGEELTIRLGGQEAFGQPITWSDPYPWIIGQSLFVPSIITGRLMALRIEGSTLRRWRLHSYRTEIAPQGFY